MEKKGSDLSSVLLTMIRSQRARAEDASDARTQRVSRATTVRQREAHFGDFEQVATLKQRLGLSSDSIENWHRLWRDNPALLRAQGPLALGWVLEAEERIVGYLGNIPLLYHYGERPLVAATATGFAVDPSYRAFSLGLLGSFYSQSYVDLFLNTTAIESVGKLAKACRAEVLPQHDYDSVLFWVLNSKAFADVLRKKIGVDGPFGAIGRVLGSLSLKTDTAVRRRRPLRPKAEYRIVSRPISDIGSDFDEIWQKALLGRPRLIADRDPLHLEWHFSIPKSESVIHVLRCEKEGRLRGYAVLRLETERQTGLRRCFLADLLVEDDESAAIESLLSAAYDLAKSRGCHILEVLGFPSQIRKVLQKGKPYSRKFPAPPFHFKAKDRALHQALRSEDSWYACPFDGDTSLMP